MSQPYAAGSLYSTVEDLARWDRALAEGKLISGDSCAKMYTPLKNNYAYGWVVATAKGRKEIHHGGGINGFATEILRYPEQQMCVVVLSNVLPVNPGRIAHDLAAIAFGEPHEQPRARKVAEVNPKVYDAYVGRYELEPKVIATIARERDRLLLQLTDQPQVEMFPESETIFFLKVVDAMVTFIKDDQGKVSGMVIHQGYRNTKAKRLEAEAPEQGALRVTSRLGRSPSPRGLPDAPGGVHGRLGLPERLPAESHEGASGAGIGGPEVRDIGQGDEDRIAALDVVRRLARSRQGECEEDGFSGLERLAGGQRDDRLAAPASLDFRDPLFVGGISVHSGPHRMDGRSIDDEAPRTNRGQVSANEGTRGSNASTGRALASLEVDHSGVLDQTALSLVYARVK